MRGFGGFLAYRLFRTLVALWLVSTVVFVVMRLSGDPVPLLLLLPPELDAAAGQQCFDQLLLQAPSTISPEV